MAKFLIIFLLLLPLILRADTNPRLQFAATLKEALNPDKWFDLFKKSITIPLPATEVKIPTPEEALKETSPKLQEINRDIKEEVGIDFAKFFGWFAKVLKVFFQFIVDLLETLSKALGG